MASQVISHAIKSWELAFILAHRGRLPTEYEIEKAKDDILRIHDEVFGNRNQATYCVTIEDLRRLFIRLSEHALKTIGE